MSSYIIRPHGKGFIVERGVFLGIFADRQIAEEYVVAHQNFRQSVSESFVSPDTVRAADTAALENECK